jgi:hypothetical protein
MLLRKVIVLIYTYKQSAWDSTEKDLKKFPNSCKIAINNQIVAIENA